MAYETSNDNVQEYVHEILQILEIITDNLSELNANTQRDVLNSLYRGFHAVKGNANLAGFTRAVNLAGRLEDILAVVRAGAIDVDSGFITVMSNAVEILSAISVEGSSDGLQMDNSELSEKYDTIVSSLDNLEKGGAGGSSSEGDYLTGLENKTVSDDIADGVSVDGGGVTLEIIDGDIAANNDVIGVRLPKNSDRQLRILVVEDDFTSRQLLVSALSKFGECHVAKDGAESVEAVNKSFDMLPLMTYDLICMDVQMPNMDGTDAVKMIREIERQHDVEGTEFESVIIMVSSVEDPKVIMKSCYKCGANHYFVKPLDLHQMNRQLQKLGLIAEMSAVYSV